MSPAALVRYAVLHVKMYLLSNGNMTIRLVRCTILESLTDYKSRDFKGPMTGEHVYIILVIVCVKVLRIQTGMNECVLDRAKHHFVLFIELGAVELRESSGFVLLQLCKMFRAVYVITQKKTT